MFRKIICLATALAAMAFFSISCFALTQEVEKDVPVPPKIVFLGDSIPDGYGLEGFSLEDNSKCNSYPNIIGEKFKSEISDLCEAEMVNNAVSGDTSSQLLEHLQSGEFDNALSDSDAVVISIGGNDILEIFINVLVDELGLSSETLDEWKSGNVNFLAVASALQSMSSDMDLALDKFQTNLGDIISDIKSKTSAKIFVQTLYNPFEDFKYASFLEDLSNQKIGRLNQIINDYSTDGENSNYFVVDVASSFSGRCNEITNINDFDIHPNAEGHQIIADVVENAVRTQKYTYTVTEEIPEPSNASIIIGLGAFGVILVLIATAIVVNRKKHH